MSTQPPAAPRMPLRIGIDTVAVSDVAETLRVHGDRYLGRVYTAHEVEECRAGHGLRVERLAARWAAKEAALKVLRPTGAVPWREIEVRRAPAGWTDIRLRDRAAELATEEGIAAWTVSLTHESGLASAVVVGEVSR